MERSNKDKPKWIKRSHGTLVLRSPSKLRLKHNQEFRASVEELGKYIDQFELLENVKGKYKVKKKKDEPEDSNKGEQPPEEIYDIEHVAGGWYNVVSPTGKVMNEKKVKSEDAEKLKLKLESKQ